MQYIIKKIGILIITLFLISVLSFAAFNIIPGDAAVVMLGTQASDESISNLREELGLNKSVVTQYTDWVTKFIKGDYGKSIKYTRPVRAIISERIPITIWLAVISIIIILVISIPLGIFTAKKANSISNVLISGITIIGISVPGFFLAVIIMWIFGFKLHLFAIGGYISPSESVLGFIKYMIFPAVAISFSSIAILIKYLRSSVISELRSDYVRTAYSKGNSENAVLYKHVLRNSIVTVISLIGMIVSSVFSGSIIVEQIFSVPGIGSLLITAINARDFPLTQALVVYIAAIVVITNTLVDIAVQIIDPRIRI